MWKETFVALFQALCRLCWWNCGQPCRMRGVVANIWTRGLQIQSRVGPIQQHQNNLLTELLHYHMFDMIFRVNRVVQISLTVQPVMNLCCFKVPCVYRNTVYLEFIVFLCKSWYMYVCCNLLLSWITSVGLKNERSFISAPPYVFMVCTGTTLPLPL
jgi:hypothetical protein